MNSVVSGTVFKYLGSVAGEKGGVKNGDQKQRVSTTWRNRKKGSGVLCDRKLPMKLKGKICETVVRAAMLYGTETWETTKGQEQKMEMNEMTLLKWMYDVTKKGMIRNEFIRGTTRVIQDCT